MDYYIVKRE